jgi:hypothetical protein
LPEPELVIKSNRHEYLTIGSRCMRYKPCPICFKCMHKASHLYVKCQNCSVPLCVHSEKERAAMIRRENFSPRFPLRGGGEVL